MACSFVMTNCKHASSCGVNTLTLIEGKLSYMSNFGQRLKQARDDKLLNKSELARLVGVSPQRIVQIEKNGGELSAGPAVKAADVLGVRVRWLALGEKPKEASPTTPSTLDESDLSLLRDWAELLPEQRERYRTQIASDADQARKVIAQARARGILPDGPPVGNDRVEAAGFRPIHVKAARSGTHKKAT